VRIYNLSQYNGSAQEISKSIEAELHFAVRDIWDLGYVTFDISNQNKHRLW